VKATVDDSCIACELCVSTCPEVFEMGDAIAVVKADPVPPAAEASCRDAADACPVDAITITE